MTSPIAVIDFETTGGSMAQGARATEIAIVRVEDGHITGHFQSLMCTGAYIPAFITQLTGITNAMVAEAPPAAEVMAEARRFVGSTPLIAHNAPFDRSFWRGELALAGLDAPHEFACTVRLSRRLYPEAPSHKLGQLADFHALPRNGRAHRALSDAQVTAELLLKIQHDLRTRWNIAQPDHALLMGLQDCPARQLPRWLAARAQPALLD